MNKSVKKEIEQLIEKLELNCTVEEFPNKVDWDSISFPQTLSEEFIREFKDKINWSYISIYQKLSENFVREFQNKLDWRFIWYCQEELSDEFLEEFKDKWGMWDI